MPKNTINLKEIMELKHLIKQEEDECAAHNLRMEEFEKETKAKLQAIDDKAKIFWNGFWEKITKYCKDNNLLDENDEGCLVYNPETKDIINDPQALRKEMMSKVLSEVLGMDIDQCDLDEGLEFLDKKKAGMH